ncbi:MAG TPA: YfhO family protein [Candidatus Paceibacterota bacterium]|nr:YfhO family protein [Verrucomicrobiota bacterium]HSA09206.1 YfhO family protein [Candidatus Paceibacterota bacterium]
MSGEAIRARREDLLVVAAIGLFAAVLCFAGTKLVESWDYVQFLGPNLQFLREAVQEGRLPLWNPYIGLGRPYLADTQMLVFYPPVYLICLGQGLGSFLLVWLHCALGVFGMRALGGALQVGRWQSYFMAACYLGSCSLTARWMTGQVHYCWALCYVPALFYCALRTEGPWRCERIGWHALLLALQFLCGHPQVFWFTGIGQGVFILGRAVRLPLGQALLDAVRSLGQLGAAGIWCTGLVAMVLLPFLELAKQGNRYRASPAFANYFKLEWAEFESLLSPLGIWGGREWVTWETTLYFGPIALVFGLAGLCRLREHSVRGLLAVVIVALLLALGDNTPFFPLFYKWLPGFSGFRIHPREAVLAVLALICAAGIWLSRPHPRLRALWRRKFGTPVSPVLVGAVLLQGLSLVYGTWIIKQACNYTVIFKVRPDHSFQRVLAAQLREAGLLEPAQPPPRVCVPWALVPANYAMVYRYSTFDANCSLFLRRPWEYLHSTLGIQPPDFDNNSLAGEVYDRGPFPYPDLGLVAGVDTSEWTLQFASNAAPRAYVVYATEVVDEAGGVLKRLVQGHDIHKSALLEKPLSDPLAPHSSLPGAAATIRRFEPNWLLVEVEAKTNGLLVLSEAWYPGWRAEIDGQTRACVPANHWMRAVPVPAGRHLVRVYFHQNYLLPGLLISIACAGMLLLILAGPKEAAAPCPTTASREKVRVTSWRRAANQG